MVCSKKQVDDGSKSPGHITATLFSEQSGVDKEHAAISLNPNSGLYSIQSNKLLSETHVLADNENVCCQEPTDADIDYNPVIVCSSVTKTGLFSNVLTSVQANTKTSNRLIKDANAKASKLTHSGRTSMSHALGLQVVGTLFLPSIMFTMVCGLNLAAGKPLDVSDTCHPQLGLVHESAFEKGSTIDLNCQLRSCHTPAVVVYEKTDGMQSSMWMQVYQGTNKTHHSALSTHTGYDLGNRGVEYATFTANHILVINPLMLDDQGQWKCTVYDNRNIPYESNTLNIDVLVIPEDGAATISPIKTVVVLNHTLKFVCDVSGISPEPDVHWTMNGAEYAEAETKTHQHKDKLWTVRSTIQFRSQHIETVNLSCMISSNDQRELLIRKSVVFDVKAAASIISPLIEQNLETEFKFTLNCTGSGYRPLITWEKNGRPINKPDYVTTTHCKGDNHTCYSILSPNPERLNMAYMYTGVYSCVVTLEPPYHTTPSAKSAAMNLYIMISDRSEAHAREIFLMVIFGLLLFAVLIIVAVYSLPRIGRCRRSDEESWHIEHQVKIKENVDDQLSDTNNLSQSEPLDPRNTTR